MFTRKNFWIIGVLSLAVIFVLIFFSNNFLSLQSPRNSQPRIVELEKFRVRILWNTVQPFRSQLWYSSEGKPEQYLEEKGKRSKHVAEISGLMPETVYNYRLSKTAREVYSFKTAPLSETAFRFMIYNQYNGFHPKNLTQFIQAIKAQMPDFIILTGKLSRKKYIAEEQDFFKNVRSATGIPIFIAPEAGDLSDPKAGNYFRSLIPKDNYGHDYAFDYGNSRFILLNPGLKIAPTAGSKSKRSGWLNGKIINNRPSHLFVLISDPVSIEKNYPEIFQVLSRMSSERKIDAVFSNGRFGPKSGMTGAKLIDDFDRYLVIDVDGAGVTATVRRHGLSKFDILTINETPEAVKRSCVYCRKLLDTQRYQESIDWYRKFITEFGARYMVDDAQFEIANIYDQYLFDYPSALQEYRKLVTEYPNSYKNRQASQRIAYLTAYSDYNFNPLRIFEKAKSQTYQRDRKKAVAEIETIPEKFPGAKIEPQVLYWLGYTLAETDLEKSVSYYRQLIRKYPEKENAGEAWIALGDAYYLHNKYREAIAIYNSALKKSGSLYNFGLLDKIRKCNRNIMRINLAYIFTAVLLFSYLLALFWRPRFLTVNELKLGFYLFLVYLAGGTFIWAVFFRNYPELIKMIPALAPVAATVPMVTTALFRKILQHPPEALRWVGILPVTLILSVIVFYVFLYYYCSHYLMVFGF